MKAQETTFQQLIQGEKQFQVPLYQRTYSWDRRQLSRLWTDVLEQAESLREPGAASTHFLGSVVLVPSPSLQASGVQKWLVVDDKQRLTTLMLAMCAIRDHLGTHDPQQRDRINELYLMNKWQRDLERFRLLPTQADRDAFIRCINAAPNAGSGDKLGAAYRFFQTALLDADDVDDPHDITRIETVIRERLAIVEITCERHDNVHRIFESLNNTGLSLSQADLLRNYVFMLLPARGQEVYSDVWLPMQESLGARNLELLAWLDLLLRGQERVRLTEVYEAQKRRLEPLAADEAAIAGEVGELARRAVLLRRILEPGNEPDARLRAAFDRLNRWQAQTAYPVLLRLLELQARGRCGADELVEALSYVESFLVRRMLVGVPTNNLNRIFNAVTQELEHADSVPHTLRTALSAQRRRWPRDDEVRDAIRSRPFYWQGRAAQRVLVLRRLEEDLGSGEPVDYRAADLTIEHVLPQTLSDRWRAELASDIADDSTVDELHELLVHTLGNLTLTAYNPALGNLPFDEKRTKLRDSALRMTSGSPPGRAGARRRSTSEPQSSPTGRSASGRRRWPASSSRAMPGTGASCGRRWPRCRAARGPRTATSPSSSAAIPYPWASTCPAPRSRMPSACCNGTAPSPETSAGSTRTTAVTPSRSCEQRACTSAIGAWPIRASG